MALLIVGIVCWGVLAVLRGGGTDKTPPEEPQTGGAVLQAHRIDQPGIPMPDGPPHVIGFVLGVIVFGIGWALCQ